VKSIVDTDERFASLHEDARICARDLEQAFVEELRGALDDARSRFPPSVVEHLQAFTACIAPKFLQVQLPLYQILSALRARAEKKGIGVTEEIASSWNRLEVSYDAALDVLTVEGAKYSGNLFRHFAPGPLGFEPDPDRIFKVRGHRGEVAVIQVVTDRELSHRFDLLAKAGI
jgi:hypothetical protein